MVRPMNSGIWGATALPRAWVLSIWKEIPSSDAEPKGGGVRRTDLVKIGDFGMIHPVSHDDGGPKLDSDWDWSPQGLDFMPNSAYALASVPRL